MSAPNSNSNPNPTPTATILSLDHSIPTTITFYTTHLGMHHTSFTLPRDPTVTRHALVFGDQKINLHQHGVEFEPKARNVTPGSADLCFITETPVDDVLEGFRRKGVEVLEGGQVVEREGARGRRLRSVYVRDPDGNLVE